jgi:hypothetical protein
VDGEHFIAAPNSGTALCLASVNLFPSPKSDEPPEAAFHRLRFRTEHHLGRSVSLLLALSAHTERVEEEPPTTIQQKVARRGCLYRVYHRRPAMGSASQIRSGIDTGRCTSEGYTAILLHGLFPSYPATSFIGWNLRPGCARASRDRVRSPTAPQPASPRRCRSC